MGAARWSQKKSLHELTDEESYETEISTCPGVTGFHRWFFLTALAEATGLRFRAFAITSGGTKIGVLPLLFRRRGPVSTVNYLPVPHIGPLLCSGQALEVLLHAADAHLFRQRAVVTKWNFAPTVHVEEGLLERRGFKVSRDRNYVVSSDKTLEEHLATLSPRQRRYLKQSEAKGMHARSSTPEEVRAWFPQRVDTPYQRQGISPDYSVNEARQLAACLADHPSMLWRTVCGEAGPLTVSAWIIDSNRLWGWLMVNDRGPGPTSNVLAYQDAVAWSLPRKLSCDFGGAPTNAIGEFKERMGGQLEEAVTAERVRPTAYRAVRSLHTQIRRCEKP